MAKKTQANNFEPNLSGEIELDLDQLVESTLPTQKRRQTRLQKDIQNFEQGLGTLGLSIKKTKGVIRSTVWVGPDGTVRKHWARVADAAKHPAAVLEAMTSA